MWMEILTNCYESVLFVIFLIGFLGFKDERRRNIPASVLCGGLLFLNIMLSDMTIVYSRYTIIVDFGITFVFYCICLGGLKRDFIVAFFLYCVGASLCANAIAGVFYILNQEGIEMWIEVDSKYRIVALALSRICLTAYLVFILYYKYKWRFNNKAYYFYFVIIALIWEFLFSVLFPVLMELYEQSPQIGEKVFVVLTCLMILVCIFLALVMHMSKMARYKIENDALHNMLKSERNAMKKYIQKENEVYKWAHDLKNRILGIRFLAKKDFSEADRELETLAGELNEKMGALISAENIWECILESKGIEERGIRLEKKIESGGIQIDAVDVGILFGNLLDNAIEAVEKIQNGDRVIWVEVCVAMNMLGISVINTTEGKNEVLHLRTSKDDSRRHGYGIQSIRSIAEKYEGSCEFYLKEGKFVAEIQLLNDIL